MRRALRVGVLEDVAEDGGRSDLGDVVGALDAGVEELARHGQADAQQEPEDAGEREVAQRLRRDGRAGDLGVVDEGGLDDGGGLAAGRLELLDDELQLLGVGLRDVAGALRVGVGGLDLEQHRLRDGRGGDLLAQLHRVGVAELVGHALGELVAGHQVGVRRHALGGEEVAGVGGVLVGLAGRDEDPGGGGVGRGHRPRPHRGDRQDHQDTPENQPPPPSDGAPVVLQLHAVSSSCQRNFDKRKRSVALVRHRRGRVDGGRRAWENAPTAGRPSSSPRARAGSPGPRAGRWSAGRTSAAPAACAGSPRRWAGPPARRGRCRR